MQLSRRRMIRLKVMAASGLALRTSALFARIPEKTAEPAKAVGDGWFWLPGGAFTVQSGAAGGKTGPASLLTSAAPHHGSLLHQHTREDELFQVLSGSFQIEVGDRSFHLDRGSSVMAPKGVPHRWTNVGCEHGKLLSTYSPAGLEDVFLSLAVPIASPSIIPAVDISVLGPSILQKVLEAGITQAGPACFPHLG